MFDPSKLDVILTNKQASKQASKQADRQTVSHQVIETKGVICTFLCASGDEPDELWKICKDSKTGSCLNISKSVVRRSGGSHGMGLLTLMT